MLLAFNLKLEAQQSRSHCRAALRFWALNSNLNSDSGNFLSRNLVEVAPTLLVEKNLTSSPPDLTAERGSRDIALEYYIQVLRMYYLNANIQVIRSKYFSHPTFYTQPAPGFLPTLGRFRSPSEASLRWFFVTPPPPRPLQKKKTEQRYKWRNS